MAGIVDVETLWAGDPAMDIAVLHATPRVFNDGVLDGYDPSATEERRLRQVPVLHLPPIALRSPLLAGAGTSSAA